MKLTIETLKEYNACTPGLHAFRNMFGRAVDITPENCLTAITHDIPVSFIESLFVGNSSEYYRAMMVKIQSERDEWKDDIRASFNTQYQAIVSKYESADFTQDTIRVEFQNMRDSLYEERRARLELAEKTFNEERAKILAVAITLFLVERSETKKRERRERLEAEKRLGYIPF